MSNNQTPLGTYWGPAATAAQVVQAVDLTGKTVLVTGGSSGLGLETTKALASRGASVIVPARRVGAAAEAFSGIDGVEVHEMDLIDRSSIERFAKSFSESGRTLDILVLSAGVMATPLFRDADGHEGQFTTNHLGHFRLTQLLWPALCRAQAARVVALSSRGHQITGVDFDDLDFRKRSYDKWQAYGQSKTANALFAVALDERGRDKGIMAFSVHPGSIVGPLARHLSAEEIAAFGALDADNNPVIDPDSDKKNFAQGASTIVWCATSPELEGRGGLYCENCDVAPIEETANFGVRSYAIDPGIADRLWNVSVELTH